MTNSQHTAEQAQEYKATGKPVYVLRATNVDIIFDDVVTAHQWAELRGLEAWTVTESRIWTTL
jgi:hypothetical protein